MLVIKTTDDPLLQSSLVNLESVVQAAVQLYQKAAFHQRSTIQTHPALFHPLGQLLSQV